ncbi:adenylate kinase [Arenibacter algicola]|mgnify:FL=1|uniref:Adenylate kinase n=1 Tax=Arenibacter algicola TaxID=616991 RepID=A0A221URF8_9FLAO|nr:adenylate kinase [Arenibacter algicola]ASO03892.1 adenylate kinase [Arenibacter algicola]MDX1758970.1 adenylate kinase [Arenibacter algicola]HCO84490.1 adenylate kinase [Arenibacter sp.]
MIKLHDKYFKPFISEGEIMAAIKKIADQVAVDYKKETPIFVGVLNGAFMFVSDFLKAYPHPCEVSFVRLSSYQGLTSTGIVESLLDVPENIEGRSVIILEDIIDTGRTVKKLIDLFSNTKVKEFKIATLFYKSEVYNGEYDIDYFGMKIEDKFIVGYGLDYNELGRNLRAVYQLNQKHMINLVLFGKPGAGKGTQASFLKEKYNLKHISTGDVFRYNIKNGTELGTLAKSYIDKGELVPDEVTIKMLQDEVEKNPDASGFIFDGFPRTTAQAKALDDFLVSKEMRIDATIALEANDEVLIQRLLERGKVSGRSDDQDENMIRNRFDEYNEKTAPLKDYYDDQGKFHSVNGIGSIEDITSRLAKVIEELQAV